MIIINTNSQTNTVISYLVVTGPAGALDPLVAEQVEVALSGMVDPLVYHSPRQSVPVTILVVVCWEEPAGIEI